MEIGFRINIYRNTEDAPADTTQGAEKATQGTAQVTQDTKKTTQDTTQVRLESEMREIIFYKMKQQNIIKRVGTSQKGYWEILIEDNIWRN